MSDSLHTKQTMESHRKVALALCIFGVLCSNLSPLNTDVCDMLP